MAPRARWAWLAGLLVVLAGTVVVAGRGSEPPPPVTGVEWLGPEPGDPVASYLGQAGRSLPAPGAGEVWALVQLSDYLDPPAAAALVRGVRVATVVLRVPLPGVQTALVYRDLPGQHPAEELAAALRAAGQDRAGAAAQAPPGSRAGAVATVEAARLRAGCACVLALLVRGDRDALAGLAGRAEVRAVHAAGPGTPPQQLSLAPLLPEQHDVVGPVPDDGPLPPAGDDGGQ